jgi:hypothetical protein
MTLKKKISVVLMTLILAGVIVAFSVPSKKDAGYYETIADRITCQTAIALRKEKGLYLSGTGGGMMYGVRMLHMSLDYLQPMPLGDLAKARELVLYAADLYWKNINDNEELRPYFFEYPFDIKRLYITVFPDDSEVDYLCHFHSITLNEGVIGYYIPDPDGFKIHCLYKETYEEAKKAHLTMLTQSVTK